MTPEEKLLHAIFGRAGEDVKNDSLEVPAGTEGVVIGAQRFSRRMHMSDEQKKQLKKDIEAYEAEMDKKAIEIFRQMVEEVNEITGQVNNVVFLEGLSFYNNQWWLYYGTADSRIAVAKSY